MKGQGTLRSFALWSWRRRVSTYGVIHERSCQKVPVNPRALTIILFRAAPRAQITSRRLQKPLQLLCFLRPFSSPLSTLSFHTNLFFCFYVHPIRNSQTHKMRTKQKNIIVFGGLALRREIKKANESEVYKCHFRKVKGES